jgi:magnesium chelatase subunit D
VPDAEDVQRALDGDGPQDEPPRGGGGRAPQRPDGERSSGGERRSGGGREPRFSPTALARERLDAPVNAHFPLRELTLAGVGSGPLGRRARTAGPGAGAIDTRQAPGGRETVDLATVATLRARLLGAPGDHVREHVRAGRESAFICLVLDASGSMGAQRRAARVKGALIELLRDAYARRDRVAVLAFRDSAARTIVEPGAPLERAAAAIRALPTGGRTPLASGLAEAARVVLRERVRDSERRSIAIVITDGRVQDGAGEVARGAALLGRVCDAVHVIDIEDGPVRLGLARSVAAAAGGRVHRIGRAA